MKATLESIETHPDSEILVSLIGKAGLELFRRAGSIRNLLRWDLDQMKTVPGITSKKAATIQAAINLHSRKDVFDDEIFDDPAKVHRHFSERQRSLTVEKFWVLCLDRKNRLIKEVEVSSGTATSCAVHAREVFRNAIFHSASAVIAVHNHPSSNSAPSRADIAVTKKLKQAGDILDISLLDHVIVGNENGDPTGAGYYSFQESGIL